MKDKPVIDKLFKVFLIKYIVVSVCIRMPTFKPKSSKKIQVCEKSTTTLDGKHKEIIEKIRQEEEEVLPDLLRRKKNTKAALKRAKTTEAKLELQDRLDDLRLEIKRIKMAKKEYYLDNSQYIFNYFENKKDVASGKTKAKMLNHFFNIGGDENTDDKTASTVQEYLANVDETFIDVADFVVQTDVCPHCRKGEMIAIDHEGMMVCNNCSISVNSLIENEKPSYKEPPKEVCFYAYKRINHFREILAQFQAKETTQIPDEVLENIKNQIKKERIKLSQITNKRAKEILKKLGYNKYYEHIPFIKDKLGIKPPVMSPELEERLCSLFMDIQAPYAKYCPEDRVNFLNYYYTVYKLCELLEQHQFLPFFPMLKDREKRIEQDEIWKKICEELEWEFIPTI